MVAGSRRSLLKALRHAAQGHFPFLARASFLPLGYQARIIRSNNERDIESVYIIQISIEILIIQFVQLFKIVLDFAQHPDRKGEFEVGV